jgi:hypothetical protein
VSSQEQEVKAMRRHLVLTEVVVSLTLAATAGLRAHHAVAAECDASKPVNFKGTVIKMQWTNCHVWLHINVTKADGTTEPGAFEAGTPNVLFRRGFTKESLLPGT